MVRVTEKDRLRFGAIPDPDFSEERNRKVIAATIKNADDNQKRKQKLFDEGLRDRSDMVYSFIRHISRGGNEDKTIEKYLGRERMMKLMGEERILEMQRMLSMQDKLLK
jgi:hypothetical protein